MFYTGEAHGIRNLYSTHVRKLFVILGKDPRISQFKLHINYNGCITDSVRRIHGRKNP